MIGGARLLDTAQCEPCGLIGVALQPQSPRKEDSRHYFRGDLKANDAPVIRSNRSNRSGEYAFEPASRARLIAQMMLRDAKHSLAEQFSEWSGGADRRDAESLG